MGNYFRYPTLDMAALERLESVFDKLSLREATERLCVVLRDGEGRLLCAFADPTATGLQAWAEARAGVPLDWHLAHPADLRVFLARHEEGMHALESAVSGPTPRIPKSSSRAVESESSRVLATTTSAMAVRSSSPFSRTLCQPSLSAPTFSSASLAARVPASSTNLRYFVSCPSVLADVVDVFAIGIILPSWLSILSRTGMVGL